MINWRDIKTDGFPTDVNKKYLVTDGIEISTTEISGITKYNVNNTKVFTFRDWIGDENSGEENNCCSGERYFSITPTHWCPTDELNLPNK